MENNKLTKEQEQEELPNPNTEEMPAVVGKASRKRAGKIRFAKDSKKLKSKEVAKGSQNAAKVAKKPKPEEAQEASNPKGNEDDEPCTPEGKQPPRLPFKTQHRSKLETWYFKPKRSEQKDNNEKKLTVKKQKKSTE